MNISYAATVRKHFPNFRYTKCYSSATRIKYWLPQGIEGGSPTWSAMVAELNKQGVKHVRLLPASIRMGRGLALYFRDDRIPG
jgi:hypothetical protein